MQLILQKYKTLFFISLLIPFTLYFTAYGNEFIFQRGVLLSILVYFLISYFGLVKDYPYAQFAMKVFLLLHFIALLLSVIGFFLFF